MSLFSKRPPTPSEAAAALQAMAANPNLPYRGGVTQASLTGLSQQAMDAYKNVVLGGGGGSWLGSSGAGGMTISDGYTSSQMSHIDGDISELKRRVETMARDRTANYDGKILTMEVNWRGQREAKFACTAEHLVLAAGLPADIHLKMVSTTATGELSIVALIDNHVSAHDFSPTEVDGGPAYVETILRWKANTKPDVAAGQPATP